MNSQNKRQSANYEIRVRGLLDRRWSRRFEGMTITPLPGGYTQIAGPIVDQAALHGVLNSIGDLGLELVLVRKSDTNEAKGAGEEAEPK